MCGIFGIATTKINSAIGNQVFTGLKNLEYRGYDSWGICTHQNTKFNSFKKIGKLPDNPPKPTSSMKGSLAIGHTRWATHGGVTTNNAHPHAPIDKSFYLAQNGIVENYSDLKKGLIQSGYTFTTQTDTEVIVNLIHQAYVKNSNWLQAVNTAFNQLQGRNTIILITNDGHLLAVKHGSPLLIGIHNQTYYISSDILSLTPHTHKIYQASNHDLIHYHQGKLDLYHAPNLKPKKLSFSTIKPDKTHLSSSTKNGHPHYMIKEIMEQPQSVKSISNYTQKQLNPLVRAIDQARTVYTIGAGTASFAAAQIAYYLRTIGKTHTVELAAYEADSYLRLMNSNDLIIAISQSGETADTIAALESAKSKGVKIASIVNMPLSTITRLSDYPFMAKAGPEICVLSTKTFTAQICWGYLLASTIAGKHSKATTQLHNFSQILQELLAGNLPNSCKRLAKELVRYQHAFVLARGQNYAIARETALKIKEVTYRHYEAFSAGELKHGVIALIEDKTPVWIISSNDSHSPHIINAAQEVKARGATLIGINKTHNEIYDHQITLPDAGDLDPLVNLIPAQLTAYYMAVELNLDPDKPRHLAKSVTVQ